MDFCQLKVLKANKMRNEKANMQFIVDETF